MCKLCVLCCFTEPQKMTKGAVVSSSAVSVRDDGVNLGGIQFLDKWNDDIMFVQKICRLPLKDLHLLLLQSWKERSVQKVNVSRGWMMMLSFKFFVVYHWKMLQGHVSSRVGGGTYGAVHSCIHWIQCKFLSRTECKYHDPCFLVLFISSLFLILWMIRFILPSKFVHSRSAFIDLSFLKFAGFDVNKEVVKNLLSNLSNLHYLEHLRVDDTWLFPFGFWYLHEISSFTFIELYPVVFNF